MLRILVVEDEAKSAEFLQRGLGENGYVVDVARDGVEGRRLATGGDYALILLDVMLPGLDGFALLDTVRKQGHTPVLMLTARERVEDRVRGLQAGADDYLIKPYAFSELLARVQALLRRGAGGAALKPMQLALADLELDLETRRVQRAGRRVELSAQGVPGC